MLTPRCLMQPLPVLRGADSPTRHPPTPPPSPTLLITHCLVQSLDHHRNRHPGASQNLYLISSPPQGCAQDEFTTATSYPRPHLQMAKCCRCDKRRTSAVHRAPRRYLLDGAPLEQQQPALASVLRAQSDANVVGEGACKKLRRRARADAERACVRVLAGRFAGRLASNGQRVGCYAQPNADGRAT
eukprot:4182547-Pleurochrysis_carterae.AAC.1